MDFIATLASQLGVDGKVAEALAGTLLGAAREQVGDEETAKLDEAVPEIEGWRAMADEVMNQGGDDKGGDQGGGLFGSLARMAGSGLGNELVGAVLGDDAQETATLVGLMSKLGLKTEHASMAAPLVLQFLEDRLGDEWTQRVLSGAPMLMGFLKSQAKGDN